MATYRLALTQPQYGNATLEPFGLWRSLVARSVRVGEVAGSNPVSPIQGFPPHRFARPRNWRNQRQTRGLAGSCGRKTDARPMHPCALHRFVGRCRPPPHALMGRYPSSTSETIHRSPVCGGGGQGRPSPWWSCRRRRPRARHEPPGINDTRGCAGHPCVTDRDHGVVLGPKFDYGGGTVGTPMLGQKGVYTARSSSEALASGSSGGLYAETWRA